MMVRASFVLVVWLGTTFTFWLGAPVQAQPRMSSERTEVTPVQAAPLDRVLAVINADVITQRELLQRTRNIETRLRAQNMALPPDVNVQREVLERMIIERALLQRARQVGVRIEDAWVERALARMAAEQGITVDEWRVRWQEQGGLWAQLQEEVAQDMTLARLREREVDARVQVSDAEVDREVAQQMQLAARAASYQIQQWLVAVPEGATPVQWRQAQVRAQELAQQAQQYADFAGLASEGGAGGTLSLRFTDLGMRPAERLPALWITAVEGLQPGEVAPLAQSAAGFHVIKLIARERVAIDPFDAPLQQTHVAHILVRVDALNPESEVVRRLKEVRERIAADVVTFAEMARQYSADGSAAQGGDLGWIDQGETVPEFERAMDALEPGQLAGPVRSPFGYHLIQVLGRRTQVASPESRRAAARKQVRERKIAAAYQEFLDQVRDRAYVEVRLDD